MEKKFQGQLLQKESLLKENTKLCLCKDNTLNFFYNEQNYFFSIKEKLKYFNANGKFNIIKDVYSKSNTELERRFKVSKYAQVQ